MSRRLPVFVAAIFATAAFAQHSRFGSPSGFGNVNYPGVGHPPNAVGYSGFGNVNFPGTIRPPQAGFYGAISNPSYASRLGASIGGYSSGYLGGGFGHPAHGRSAVVAVPVIIGGYGYGYPGYDPSMMGQYYEDPNVAAQQQQQQAAPPPVVIINQSYRPPDAVSAPDYAQEPAHGVIHRYDTPVHPLPEPGELAQSQTDEKPTIYLIAFKDHTILPALAYWVEGDTLNYITEQGTPNRASLSLIDRDFSMQLNRERQVEFKLP